MVLAPPSISVTIGKPTNTIAITVFVKKPGMQMMARGFFKVSAPTPAKAKDILFVAAERTTSLT